LGGSGTSRPRHPDQPFDPIRVRIVLDGSGSALTVASLNLHAGVDDQNVPFDVVGACALLDADVVVLQEVWWPHGGWSQADDVGRALGYEVCWTPFGTGRRFPEPAVGGHGVGRWTGRPPAVVLDRRGRARGEVPGVGDVPAGRAERRSTRVGDRVGEPGRLGLAVLSRLPVRSQRTVELRCLRRDGASRAALVVVLGVGDVDVTVVGVHMAHLSQGSLWQYADLRRALAASVPAGVVAGDMNLWGPVVQRLLPGWRRAVIGRSWPARLPVGQPDHVLVRSSLRPDRGEVMAGVGSDHRPVRARLALVPAV
jgi:hypothetical protein